MTTKFRPFWFADIIATEKWLEANAEKGQHLNSYSFSGKFTFEDGEPESKQIRLIYDRHCNGKAPKGTIEKGWEQICSTKRSYAVKNADRSAKLSYTGFQTIIRLIMFFLYFVMCFCVGTLLGSALAFVDKAEKIIGEGRVGEFFIRNLQFYIPFTVALVIVIRIHASLKKISRVDETRVKGNMRTLPEEVFKYTKEEEKQLIRDGQIIKRTKIGWFYDPDIARTFVEEMAQKGWKLYHLDEMGNAFYFEKAEPCHIEFVTDLCDNISEEYIDGIKADGWTLQFMSMARILSYAMWTKEYTGVRPEFYSDSDTEYRQKKKYFLLTGLPLLLFGVVCLVLEILAVYGLVSGELEIEKNTDLIPVIINMMIYLFVGIEMWAFGLRGLKYFLNSRKPRE